MSRRGEAEIGACFLFDGKWLGVGEIVTYVTISGGELLGLLSLAGSSHALTAMDALSCSRLEIGSITTRETAVSPSRVHHRDYIK
jgi:hypothetical protein